MDDQGAGVSEVGHVAEVLEVVDQLDAGLVSALHGESKKATGTSGAYLSDTVEVFGALQASIGHEVHTRVLLQPGGDGLGVGHVLLHAQREGFNAHQSVVSSLGVHGHTKVTESDANAVEGEGKGAEVGELEAVVGGLRLGETGEFARGGAPVELAGVHDHTTGHSAVSGEVLGAGVHN